MRHTSLTVLLLVTACEPSEALNISLQQDGDRVVVDIQQAPPMFVQSCMTPVLQRAQLEDDGTLSALTTDVERAGDRWEGYWLDGEFVYPSLDEGCDMVVCMPLSDNPSLDLIAYTVVGEEAPPEALEAWLEEHGGWMELAASVAVVESVPITGELEVTLSFYESAECDGELQEVSQTTTIE